ncbi:DUF3784 domain-containing protein [Natronorubrum thiooxidans]|uniref:DUF3784 domain-containing protein n=1 Tax=Natronorubrum thiooxidans TaxID=308853 RepID=A0A1N7CC45_9EURY|nr:DUF3784 domain-containing protein [Natronorubrum thiooxidans]SIR61211.1 protein of unknown function [Natronorubrum thiooxidans]
MVNGSLIVLLIATGIVAALGVLIAYFGHVELIAGYDSDRVADEAGLATFIGTNILYVAVLMGLVTVVELLELLDNTDVLWLAFTVGVLALTVRMVLGSRRYETPR